MSRLPKWFHRSRMPKISSGIKVEWEPLFKLPSDESKPENQETKRKKRKPTVSNETNKT